jgi:DNA-binding MarR family transcriptional regulator
VVDSLLLDLQRATHVTLAALAEELRELEVRPAEANVLANLSDGAKLTVTELAHRVGCRATTMTSVLDRLERRGWIARVRHATDRRSVLVRLTRTGRPVARTVRSAYERVERDLLDGLAPAGARSLRNALHRLAEMRHG